MDPRRFLTLALAGLALSGCATLGDRVRGPAQPAPAVVSDAQAAPGSAVVPMAPPLGTMAPIPNPPEPAPRAASRRKAASVPTPASPWGTGAASIAPRSLTRRTPPPAGRSAISAANLQGRETSRPDRFVGVVQVFSYEPGRVYEVWTAPLRVTTLTLGPGETIVSKAAGDTVRWQIGETTSGRGRSERAHVMIKPLERGLETNLVLATSERVYLVQLKSGPPQAFNAAVAWDLGAASPASASTLAESEAAPDPLVAPTGPLDARFRIQPRGRRPSWTPTTVMTDGVHTFLSFPPELSSGEAPALFVLGAGGETQLVNYRQQNGLWVVDRVFDKAELRAGDRRRQVVRIVRQGDRS